MEWDEDVWKDAYALVYRCWLSRIYHLKRERFFKFCGGLFIGLGLMTIAASMEQAFATNDLASWLWLVIIIVVLAIPTDYGKKARSHAGLAREFIEIKARIIAADVLSRDQVNSFRTEILRVEMGEPKTLGALVRICQNEIAAALGNWQDIRPVPFFKKLFAHFYDWELAP